MPSPMGRCASTSPASRSPKTCGWNLRLRNKFQRNAVIAPALVGWGRAIVEDVAMVPAAADAVVLAARQDQQEILLLLEHARDGGEEARPAGARLELHLRGEYRQVAAAAGEHAGALLVV